MAADHTTVTRVLDKLLHGYDKEVRPGIAGVIKVYMLDCTGGHQGVYVGLYRGSFFTGETVYVTTNMLIKSMGPISEADMSYSMQVYFRQRWRDERLQFNLSDVNVTQFTLSNRVMKHIWKPPTYFLNGRRSKLHNITVPNQFVRIEANGNIYMSKRKKGTVEGETSLTERRGRWKGKHHRQKEGDGGRGNITNRKKGTVEEKKTSLTERRGRWKETTQTERRGGWKGKHHRQKEGDGGRKQRRQKEGDGGRKQRRQKEGDGGRGNITDRKKGTVEGETSQTERRGGWKGKHHRHKEGEGGRGNITDRKKGTVEGETSLTERRGGWKGKLHRQKEGEGGRGNITDRKKGTVEGETSQTERRGRWKGKHHRQKEGDGGRGNITDRKKGTVEGNNADRKKGTVEGETSQTIISAKCTY
ncbi:hypothetical protein ACOMHN_028273 [Nucella lapillus]